MAGQLRVDEITDEAGTGSPSFPNGLRADEITDEAGTGSPDFANGITVQGTPFTSSTLGGNYIMRTYTGPATWTKPDGLKAVKVTVVGGGGAARGSAPGPSGANPALIGTAGGTSSFGAFVSATGGGGSTLASSFGTGGSGSGGDINLTAFQSTSGYGGERFAGATAFGGLNITPGLSTTFVGVPYGGGASAGPSMGGSGGSSIKYISAASVPGPVSVTVGAGGVSTGPAPYAPLGRSGAAGVIVVEEFY
jgi:hypothetical protein